MVAAGYSLKHADQRELFDSDEEAWMEQFALSDSERALIRERDVSSTSALTASATACLTNRPRPALVRFQYL